ncbi:hypothetical protein GOBAR_AA02543 [Gossypium barbadense]|uniref:Uncharacterized protein n=1 Tax=Gossypium barbadense TaxID=3634 RepID=A0A2P5YR25_GOSBA|nr:hypothetical protein GOBAR_AA02543 [Gossypium barbadense]
MLTKFISVLETSFQNIETTLKNQQVSIQGLKTQVGQLTKLISERPQDAEGLVAPEPEPRKETGVSKGKGEVDHSDQKPETVTKNTYEPCSNNNKGPIYKERRLQIEELDEWQTQKLRTLDKPKLSQDELNTSLNQLKIGDKVLLDAADPRITTPEPNEEIPLTVLSIFPYGTVEVIYPKLGTFKVNNTRLKPYVDKVDSKDKDCKLFAPPSPCRREVSRA